jgi:plastocyanin domain-containing protein
MAVGSLRVLVRLSATNFLTREQMRSILDSLGPAINQQIFTSLDEVPITYNLPPSVDIPINSAGVQELTLVVTPNGYSPEHFAVQKGVPVVLTFRQTGQVGCGDELIFQWGQGQSATLELASLTDIQTLEFTPAETGDFSFNCPHLIYRGVMTVRN